MSASVAQFINPDSSWQTPLVNQTTPNNTTANTRASTSTAQNNDTQQEETQTTTQHPTPSSQQGSQQEHLLFSCQCDSAGTIGTLLSCLRCVVFKSQSAPGQTQTQSASGSKMQHATVYAGSNRLTFYCVQGLVKQSQFSIDLPKGLFREYFVGEEEVWLEESDDDLSTTNNDNTQGTSKLKAKETMQGGEIGINLTSVLECFSILSKNHKIKSSGSKQSSGEYASLDKVPLCMSYDHDTALFHLEFLDDGNIGGGCLVTCEVPGVAVDENGDQSGLASAFRSNPLLARTILYSDVLSLAVAELYDGPRASVVEVKLSKGGSN